MFVQPVLFSLVTISVLSNTSIGNQGNHCIVAVSSMMPPVNLGNLVLTSDAESCQKQYQELFLRAFDPILSSMGLDALKGG